MLKYFHHSYYYRNVHIGFSVTRVIGFIFGYDMGIIIIQRDSNIISVDLPVSVNANYQDLWLIHISFPSPENARECITHVQMFQCLDYLHDFANTLYACIIPNTKYTAMISNPVTNDQGINLCCQQQQTNEMVCFYMLLLHPILSTDNMPVNEL